MASIRAAVARLVPTSTAPRTDPPRPMALKAMTPMPQRITIIAITTSNSSSENPRAGGRLVCRLDIRESLFFNEIVNC